MHNKIFINYCREDSIQTSSIYNGLLQHFNKEQIYIDREVFVSEVNFIDSIHEAISKCAILLAVIGPGWLRHIQAITHEHDFVSLEIVTALNNGITVIPVLIGDTEMPLATDLPDVLKPLTQKNAMRLYNVSLDFGINKLALHIKKFLWKKEVTPEEMKQQKNRNEAEEKHRPVTNPLKQEQGHQEKIKQKITTGRKIFLSYSRIDELIATRLVNDLKNAGANIWFDRTDIRLGQIWDLEIEKALALCDCLLFLVSQSSVASNNALNEVYYALEENKKVLPLKIDDCKLPFRLKRLQYVDMTTDYQKGLANLISDLNS